MVDQFLLDFGNAERLLDALRQNRNFLSSSKYRQSMKIKKSVIAQSEPFLTEYLGEVEKHLRSLAWSHCFDKTLRTHRNQYILYMIEIELVNRINKKYFDECDYRIAFLPHCLRDLSKQCRAGTDDDIDYVCRRCSKICFVHRISELLEEHQIKPYIWMTANLRKLLRRLKEEGKRVGVFGIACLPELVNGMRLCAQARVPVLGIPLNANRCARWMGQFYDNSVDLQALKNLLA